MVEVALDLEVGSESLLGALVDAPTSELRLQGLFGDVGDMGRHAGDRQADVGASTRFVIVAAREVFVPHDRRPSHGREGDVLCRQTPRGADHDPRPELAGVVERPLKDLHAAQRPADRCRRPFDAEMREQRALRLEQV